MNTKGPVMSRGIDHLVLCVNDLKKARALYELLGFTMTPVAQHPFGTGNTLAQMDGCFLEVLAVTKPDDIPEADAENFYAPFDFQRLAKLPDGSEATVGFSLTFLSDPRLRDLSFFTCMQWRPDLFWKPDYQRHANGALTIDEVFVIAPTPADAADFLAAFADSADTETGDGL
jgi:hypothetical protein